MEKEKKGQFLKVGNKTIQILKDYERKEITVLDGEREIFHGTTREYHIWIRGVRKRIDAKNTTSI